MTDAELLHRINDYYASGGGGDVDVERVDGLVVVLHRTSDVWYLSYATPRPEASNGWHDAVAAALEVFTRAGRTPSFEWIEELAPGLDSAVVAAGLPAPDAEPLLVATRESAVVPAVAGAEGRLVTAEDDIAALRTLAHTVFGELGPLRQDEVERARRDIASGRRVQAAVFVDGQPVSVGDHTPFRGVTEITGIATLPEHRRRGFGGLVTALLAEQAFTQGCDVVYLTAASDDAARVYERVGFRRIATARTTASRSTAPEDVAGPDH